MLAICLALPAIAGAASNWALRQLPPKQLAEGGFDQVPLYAVSCPSESLCVAVGALDTVAFSQAPTGAADSWHAGYPTYAAPKQSCLEEEGETVAECSFPRGALDGVSCATESLCVAVGYEGAVYVSTDPAAGAGSWSVDEANLGAHLTAVSCPSTSLCVAVSGGYGKAAGRVLTTTAPTSGGWQSAALGGAPDLRGVSCSSPSQCVAVAKGGRIFVSTDPTGGAGAWREVGSPTPRDLQGVSCVGGTLCAAGDAGGNVLTTTDPTGAARFAATNADGSVQITGLSCPETNRCVAVDNNADVLTSTNPGGGPAGGPGAWTFENLVPFEAEANDHGQFVQNALWGASCPSVRLCVLVGAKSRIFTATEPFAKPAPPSTGGGGGRGKRTRLRPRTHLVFAERFWKGNGTHGRRIKARFRFYSRDGARGFECKRDRGRWRRCHSPLRYWVGTGHHALRVRAIGRTGLRGPVARLRFEVAHWPRHHGR